MSDSKDRELSLHASEPPGRKPYAPPKLVRFGQVQDLTRAGTSTKNEGQPGSKKVGGSDRRLKENIARVGTHPLGFGLYLFDYRAEFRAAHGTGRQFGVMADEVRPLRPAAVNVGRDGFDEVDYSVLGIRRFR